MLFTQNTFSEELFQERLKKAIEHKNFKPNCFSSSISVLIFSLSKILPTSSRWKALATSIRFLLYYTESCSSIIYTLILINL